MSTINGVPLRRPGTINTYNAAGFNAAGTSFADVLSLSGNFFANSINVTLPSEKMEMPMAHHYAFIIEQQLSKTTHFQ